MFPVVIILVFGIVEVGYLYRSSSLMSGAARSGARIASAQYGSAYNNASQEKAVADAAASAVSAELLSKGVTDTPQTLWIYHADASGNTQAGNLSSCTTECFRYTWNTGSNSWTYDSGSPGWLKPNACGTTSNDYLGVYVVARHDPLVAPASLSIRTLTQKAVFRVEPRTGCTTVNGPD